MHHFPVGWDDRLFARQLARQIANPRLTCDWEPRTPREILEAMAAADFCVCMRFHSCVFAAEVGVPFLAIDYTAGGKIIVAGEIPQHLDAMPSAKPAAAAAESVVLIATSATQSHSMNITIMPDSSERWA